MKAAVFAALMGAGLLAAPVMAQDSPVTGAGIVAQAAAPAFFRAVDDLPLMPGLQEMADEAVVFDQPEGRVVEVVARGSREIRDEAILAFYNDTLPQLGWVGEADAGFVREGEKLSLQVGGEGADAAVVRLRVAPR